jgi:UDP-4-amino-4,6-dideoxy-N-acetyl-beta-L-altrosamine transaminase
MMIPYGRQDITHEDIDEVVNVLRSDFLTQGTVVPEFEKQLHKYTNAKYSVVVSSCTSALHISCLALGLKKGDILWTSPITFVASANCALYCGASVDFVDIEPDTALMSVSALKIKLKEAKKQNKLPKIIVPVHFGGQSCDMKEIHKLGKQYGFFIIEDAAHAIGGSYNEDLIGSCVFSDITVFSFHPVKNITTGEGGSAMTNDVSLYQRMTLLRSHGITRDHNMMKEKLNDDWYYEQVTLGYNYRMTDIQAALGCSQLKRLDENIVRRNEVALFYNNNIRDDRISHLSQKINRVSAYHLYVIQIKGGVLARNKFYKKMHENGISVGIHYIPLHRQPFFSGHYDLAAAEKYYTSTCSLPIFPGIKKDQLNRVVYAIENSLD